MKKNLQPVQRIERHYFKVSVCLPGEMKGKVLKKDFATSKEAYAHVRSMALKFPSTARGFIKPGIIVWVYRVDDRWQAGGYVRKPIRTEHHVRRYRLFQTVEIAWGTYLAEVSARRLGQAKWRWWTEAPKPPKFK